MAWTINRIKQANTDAGFYFFEPASMRFFKSKCRSDQSVFEGHGGVYFTTSEQFVASDGSSPGRKWTVRRFFPATGNVETFGPFCEMTSQESRKLAKEAARIGVHALRDVFDADTYARVVERGEFA